MRTCPTVRSLTLAPRVAAELRRIGATVPGEVQMIGFKEPSLAFYQGGTIREQRDDGYLITTPRDEWPTWTAINDEWWRATLKLAPQVETQMIHQATLRGSAYAGRKRLILVHVLEKEIVPTTMPHAHE